MDKNAKNLFNIYNYSNALKINKLINKTFNKYIIGGGILRSLYTYILYLYIHLDELANM